MREVLVVEHVINFCRSGCWPHRLQSRQVVIPVTFTAASDLDSDSLGAPTIELQVARNLFAKILIRAQAKHASNFCGGVCRARSSRCDAVCDHTYAAPCARDAACWCSAA